MTPAPGVAPAGPIVVERARGIRKRLLAWYGRNARDLPWRARRDPYAILVSEIMLQQTTVAAVVPYYEAFLRRFPDWQTLAGASEQEVLAAWSGLGYYSRARNLRRAARRVLDEEGGRFPRDAARARRLPGVGEYTAGAVLSIAYGIPEPALDGNALRVLARLDAVRGAVRSAAVRRRLDAAARALLTPRCASDLNQALMELGATLCAPVAPSCLVCPLRSDCHAARDGLTADIPERAARRAPVDVDSASVAVRRNGRLLLHRRPSDEIMGGLWELPGTVPSDLEATASRRRAARALPAGPAADELPGRLAAHLGTRYGLLVRVGEPAGTIRHTVTHRRLSVRLFEGGLSGPRPAGAFRWTAPTELGRLPVAALTRKLVALLEPRRGAPRAKRAT